MTETPNAEPPTIRDPPAGRARPLVALLVAAGTIAISTAAYVALRPAPAPPEEAPPAIPSAAPLAEGPGRLAPEAEVGAAYHAWLHGDPTARDKFALLVRKFGRPVEPGLGEHPDLVAPDASRVAMLRMRSSDFGTLYFDIDTGKILAWVAQGKRGMWNEEWSLLFEAHGRDVSTVFDGVAEKALPDLPGAPLGVSRDGKIVVFERAKEDDDGDPVVLGHVWDARAGREGPALSFPRQHETLSPHLGDNPSYLGLSATGRYAAAVVGYDDKKLAVWETMTGRLVVSQPYVGEFLVAAFTEDESALFASVAVGPPSGKRTGLVRVSLPGGAIEGPVAGCTTAYFTADATSIAVTKDGTMAALGALRDACIFQVSPLRLVYKTPFVRGPLENDGVDTGGTSPTFVLGGRALVVEDKSGSNLALYRVQARAEIAHGKYLQPPSKHIADATTHLYSDTRVVMLFDGKRGPFLVDADETSKKVRRLTEDEADYRVIPPELAGAPNGAADWKYPVAHAAIEAQTCHSGDLVVPREMCP